MAEETGAHVGLQGQPAKVTFESKGYRDVYWCPELNEPVVLVYEELFEGREPVCDHCRAIIRYEEKPTGFERLHVFICHVLKPEGSP